MIEADFGLTEQAFREGNDARYAGDKHLWVKFHMHPSQDDGLSAQEGRPIFREVEYITIMQPGNKESIIDRPITEMDKNRFRRQYENWRAGNEELVEGTLLSQWPRVTAAQVKELEYFNVKTLEQLAAMSDTHAQKFMGISNLRRLAREDLQRAQDGAPSAQLVNELRSKDNQIAALQEALRDTQERLSALETAQTTQRRRKVGS